MDKVTVSRDELLSVLQQNREQHLKEYQEAVEGHKIEAAERLEEVKAKIAEQEQALAAGKVIGAVGHWVNLKVPESHERDYNRAIKMVEMSVHSQIELDEERFTELVMDEWGWKSNFTASNENYIGKFRATGLAKGLG